MPSRAGDGTAEEISILVIFNLTDRIEKHIRSRMLGICVRALPNLPVRSRALAAISRRTNPIAPLAVTTRWLIHGAPRA
jgi:hypothetical protein